MAKAPKMTLPAGNLDLTITAGKMKAITAAATGKEQTYIVPVDQLRPIPGFNVRVRETDDYRAQVEALKQSISENGFYHNKPLAGYIGREGDEDVIFVTDGYTRLEAVQELNAEDVDGKNEIAGLPVSLKPADSTLADLTIALVQDNSGRPLTPYEMGIVVQRLRGMKNDAGEPLFTKAEIANRLSVTERYIDDLEVLVAAPAKVRTAVLRGEVSSTLAIQELRKNPKKAEERITAAVTRVKAAGGTKATKKHVQAAANEVSMKKVEIRVSLATGDSIKDVLKSLASQIRSAVAHGDDDALLTDGTIVAVVQVPEVASEPAPEKAAETPKKAKGGTKAAKPAPEAPAAPETDDTGDEEAGEPVKLPPAVPTVDSDDDPDDI